MSCCCANTTRAVVANSAVTNATANPVVLTVDVPLPVGCCFDLCISKGLLVNASANVVNVADGGTTYEVYNQCADQVRYDQLICKAKAGAAKWMYAVRSASGAVCALMMRPRACSF